MQFRKNNPYHVLLVEDNPADVRLMEELMAETSPPVRISVVEDGEQAIEFLRRDGETFDSDHPDLVLLDLNLPKRDGHEVLRDIKEDPRLRRIPVVMLTSSSHQADVEKAYDLHANCYVVKPSDLDEFLRVIDGIKTFWFRSAVLPYSRQ